MKYDLTHNLAYTKSDLIYPADYENDFIYSVNMLTKREGFEWNVDEDDWELYDIASYHWSEMDNDVHNAMVQEQKAALIVYPNPTTDSQIHIAGDGASVTAVQIYSLTGRLLKTERVQAGTIDISNLPAGVYFLKAGSETVKVIKR
jgi:hypothetical protein